MKRINWRSVIRGTEVGIIILILILTALLLKIELNQTSDSLNPSKWCGYLNNSLKAHLCYRVAGDFLKFKFFDKIIEMESSWDPKAIGDSGKAYSLAQFHKPTFESFKKESQMYELSYENPKDQITLLVWAFNNRKQNHWTTYKKLIRDKKWKEIARIF